MAKSKKNLINNDDIIVSDKNVSEINAPVEAINEEVPVVKEFVRLSNKKVDEKENKQQKAVDKVITSSIENITKLGVNHDFSMSTTLLF